MPVALVNKGVWIVKLDTNTIINETAKVEHDLGDVRKHMCVS